LYLLGDGSYSKAEMVLVMCYPNTETHERFTVVYWGIHNIVNPN